MDLHSSLLDSGEQYHEKGNTHGGVPQTPFDEVQERRPWSSFAFLFEHRTPSYPSPLGLCQPTSISGMLKCRQTFASVV